MLFSGLFKILKAIIIIIVDVAILFVLWWLFFRGTPEAPGVDNTHNNQAVESYMKTYNS